VLPSPEFKVSYLLREAFISEFDEEFSDFSLLEDENFDD
jgi:hypothetical protein